ncbi:MAG: hypothetical protein A3B68_06755 [Candidatus Melainabacteria bacterium RIFCSPHIGHO2_02_FULL_34_12]|nr:MAG: hypothetical protein A3B68_06755 [Candidatus Melainabacteria bacterium RIFCSPHIGHO2_02_FULL_34_12]
MKVPDVIKSFDGSAARRLVPAGPTNLPEKNDTSAVSEVFTGDNGEISVLRSPFLNYTPIVAAAPVIDEAIQPPRLNELTPPTLEQQTETPQITPPPATDKPTDDASRTSGGGGKGGGTVSLAGQISSDSRDSQPQSSTRTTLLILALAGIGAGAISIISHFTSLFGELKRSLALAGDAAVVVIGTFAFAVAFGGNNYKQVNSGTDSLNS